MNATTTAAPTTATFLAHVSHVDRDRRDDACGICSDIGPCRMTWDEFTATYGDQPYGGTGRTTPTPSLRYTQHACPTDLEHHRLDMALRRTAEAALNLPTNGLPADLLDYLAARVEAWSPETVAALKMHLTDEQAQAQIDAAAHTTRTENSRAILVALGIDTQNIAPIDYPTISRYWIACRNAYGWRG